MRSLASNWHSIKMGNDSFLYFLERGISAKIVVSLKFCMQRQKESVFACCWIVYEIRSLE